MLSNMFPVRNASRQPSLRTENSKKCYNVKPSAYDFRTVLRAGTGKDQSIIIGCQYFLKKRKLPGQTKNLLIVASIFLAIIFLFPCDILVILSYVFVLSIK